MKTIFPYSCLRESLSSGYLPDDFIDQLRGGESLVETNTHEVSLQCDCIEIDGIYFHSEHDVDDFGYDEVDDVYRCIDDLCCANGRRGNEVFTSSDNCVYYGGSYYVKDYLSDNNLCELANGDVCSMDNACYVESEGEYHHIDDCYYWESDEEYHLEPEPDNEDDDLWGYGEGEKEVNYIDEDATSDSCQFGFGIEIEKGEMPTFTFNKVDFYEETGCVLEKDSSVSDGFELKTATYNLMNDKIFERVEPLRKWCDIENIKGAGGHVGFSCDTMNDEELLDGCKGFLPIIYAMYKGRINNTYCTGKSIDALKSDGEKMQAIRMRGHYIEFRICSAVKSFNALLFRIKFFRIIANNLNKPFAKIITMALTEGSELNTLLRGDVYSNDSKFIKLIESAIEMNEKFIGDKLTSVRIKHIEESIQKLTNKTQNVCV